MSRADLESMDPDLSDRRVAVLATDGFEQSELESPRADLDDFNYKLLEEIKRASTPDSTPDRPRRGNGGFVAPRSNGPETPSPVVSSSPRRGRGL